MQLPAHLLPILSGSAVAVMLSALPLTLGIVPRNHWYGVRTPQAMRGTEAQWYAINRRGGSVVLSLSFSALVILAGLALL